MRSIAFTLYSDLNPEISVGDTYFVISEPKNITQPRQKLGIYPMFEFSLKILYLRYMNDKLRFILTFKLPADEKAAINETFQRIYCGFRFQIIV